MGASLAICRVVLVMAMGVILSLRGGGVYKKASRGPFPEKDLTGKSR